MVQVSVFFALEVAMISETSVDWDQGLYGGNAIVGGKPPTIV